MASLENNIEKRNYNTIDLMKFIMSILVVAIHSHPLIAFENRGFLIVDIYNNILTLSVPYFFLSSGFFLGKKLLKTEDASRAIIGFIKKTVKLYLLAYTLYLPLLVYLLIRDYDSLFKAVGAFFRGFFLLGGIYEAGHLWFLLSSIYAGIFLCVLIKSKVSLKKIVVIGFVFLIIGELINYISNIPNPQIGFLEFSQKVISKTIMRGRVARGFFYIPLGVLLAQKRIHTNASLCLFVLGFTCLHLFDPVYSQYILIITSVGLFSLTRAISLPDSDLYQHCRNISIGVYILHNMIIRIYSVAIYGEVKMGLDVFVATIFICSLVSFVYFGAKQKILQKQ